MFLSRMAINPARRGARELLASPQAMHVAVLDAFEDSRSTDEGRVVWRLDRYSGHRVRLYVVSPDKPDFTHIVERAGWPTTQAWETAAYERFLDSLRVGQQWQFRLTANPVHSIRKEDWRDTKPVAHVTVAQQMDWLLSRASRWGLAVAGDPADCRIVARDVHRFRRQASTVTVAAATYEGRAEVTDTQALRRALTHGVGRAKAYGCGLLTLARLRMDSAP